jgi:formylmethanofuran dehydrogenase subunit E
LGLDVPRADKRLLVVVESDGCFSDGVAAATGCEVGHRTLRVADYGKIAATFVDCTDGRALRIRPRLDVRERVTEHAPEAESRWHAYRLAYQRMADAELLEVVAVQLTTRVERIVSHPDRRTNCADCGEEISNEREVEVERKVEVGGDVLCLACAAWRGIVAPGAGAYYREVGDD